MGKLESYKGAFILKNSKFNAQKILTPHAGGTWTFLFGPFYLLYHRVYLHALILALSMPFGNAIYLFFAKRLIIDNYLKNGWEISAHYPDGKIPKNLKGQ